MPIGRQLRALRVSAGLLQDALADKIGVSQGAVSKIENDRFNPTIDVVERWAEACGGRLLVGHAEEGIEAVPSIYAPILRACLAMSDAQVEEVRAVVEGLNHVSARDRRLILEIVRNPEVARPGVSSGA